MTNLPSDILTDKGLEDAFFYWHARHYPFKNHPNNIREIRKALYISPNDIAQKLNISKQAYLSLELRAGSEAITIKTLRKLANALDLELNIKFSHKKIPARRVWELLLPEGLKLRALRSCHPNYRPIVLANTIARLTNRPTIAKLRKINAL